jgi:predicted transposase YbfD/YdcC
MLQTANLIPLVEIFETLPDFRNPRQTRHVLSELMTVAVCGLLCGADTFEEIIEWAECKLDWLRSFMVLEYGIASADTYERVFGLLDPKCFEACFRSWVCQILPTLQQDQVVAIDGKTSRRSTNKADASPLHMVSAFATGAGLVLGQTATSEKSNEITAIPVLLETLDIKDCIVTIDAMGTQHKIAQSIREKEAHYVLCVKNNQPKLAESILQAKQKSDFEVASYFEEVSQKRAHGRHEIRRCWAVNQIDYLHEPEKWTDVQSFAVIERTRIIGDKTSVEYHAYISSLPADAKRIALAVRKHWEVENRLHWCLDV